MPFDFVTHVTLEDYTTNPPATEADGRTMDYDPLSPLPSTKATLSLHIVAV